MQRRITFALVATALASLVLTGLGALAISQLGAQARAERRVSDQLETFGEIASSLLDQSDSIAAGGGLTRGPLFDVRPTVDLDRFQPVTVTADGEIRELELRQGELRQGQRGQRQRGDEQAFGRLDDHQHHELLEGETVIWSAGGGTTGLQAIAQRDGQRGEETVAMLASQRYSSIPWQAVAWFALSSAVVLAAAALSGRLLARRLVRPLVEIKGATATIAGGDFATRVSVYGKDEVADLGRSVNAMASELERSQTLDRQFLMSVSHDLRTPLTAISGYAEALADEAAPDPAEAGVIIHNNAARLNRLVDDLLDLAKLDANRFTLAVTPTDVTVVAGRVAAGLVPKLTEFGLTLQTPTTASCLAIADPDRVAQIVGNLIENACKFASSAVTVSVANSAAMDRGAVVRLTVADDGPGISDEDLPHLFDRLYTARAQPDRAENPSGIGLAIVRELAIAMGGTVSVANRPSGGAVFTVDLPAAEPDRSRA